MNHSALPRFPSGSYTGSGKASTRPHTRRVPAALCTARIDRSRRERPTPAPGDAVTGTPALPSRAAAPGGSSLLPHGRGPGARRGGTGRATNPPPGGAAGRAAREVPQRRRSSRLVPAGAERGRGAGKLPWEREGEKEPRPGPAAQSARFPGCRPVPALPAARLA